MTKIKKCNRNKALFGALIGSAANIISSVINDRQQEQTAEEQLELAKAQNRVATVQKLNESYNATLGQGQNLYKDLYKTVVKFGGKKRIKKSDGGQVSVPFSAPTIDDYIRTHFWQPPQLNLGKDYSINTSLTTPITSTSTNTFTNAPTFDNIDLTGGVISGLGTIASGILNNIYRKNINAANLETTKNNIAANAAQFNMSSPMGINTKISNPIRVKRGYNYNNNMYI